jgi:hypothetical protein
LLVEQLLLLDHQDREQVKVEQVMGLVMGLRVKG